MADETVARLVAIMETQLRGFSRGLEQAQKIADARFGAIERRMRTTESLFGKFGTGIGSSFTRFLGTAALISFSKSVLDMASSLGEQAQQIGVSVEGLQAYRSALATANISAAETDTLLTRLTRNIGEAAGGSKTLQEAFKQVGISASELSGGPEALLPKIAAALLRIPEASSRAKVEFDLFGRSGQKLESALGILSTSTSDLIEKQKALGLVIGEDVVAAADRAADSLTEAFKRLQVAAAPFLVTVQNAVSALLQLGTSAVTGSVDNLERSLLQPMFPNARTTTGLPVAPAVPQQKPLKESDVNTAIRIANVIDEAMKKEQDALRDFHDKRQELIDKANREEEEALQEFHDHRQEMIDKSALDEEEALIAFHEKRQDLIDGVREREEATSAAIGDALRNAFDITGAAGVGAFEDIEGAAQQALKQIASMVFQLGVMEPLLNGIFGKKGEGGGLWGALVDAITGTQIPGRASGGPVSAGNPYWVGERGRELFVPKVPGVIMPKGAMGGSTHLNWTINVRGTTDKELMAQMRAGAAQLLGEYDRNLLPQRVRRIQDDPLFMR